MRTVFLTGSGRTLRALVLVALTALVMVVVPRGAMAASYTIVQVSNGVSADTIHLNNTGMVLSAQGLWVNGMLTPEPNEVAPRPIGLMDNGDALWAAAVSPSGGGIKYFWTHDDGKPNTPDSFPGTREPTAVAPSGYIAGNYNSVGGVCNGSSMCETWVRPAAPGSAITSLFKADCSNTAYCNAKADAVNSAGHVVGSYKEQSNTMNSTTEGAVFDATDDGGCANVAIATQGDYLQRDCAAVPDYHLKPAGTDLGSSVTWQSVNSSGVVVGTLQTFNNSPVTAGARIYEAGHPVNLNSLLPAGSGWVLNDAVAVNDAGQIAGVGTLNGSDAVFLLTPVPPLKIGLVGAPANPAPGATFDLQLTLTNTSSTPLTMVTPFLVPGGVGFTNQIYAAAQQGSARLVGGPTPTLPTTLAAGQTTTHVLHFQALGDGYLTIKASFTATLQADGSQHTAQHFAQITIGHPTLTPQQANAAVANSLGSYFDRLHTFLNAKRAQYAQTLAASLRKGLPAKLYDRLFGKRGSPTISDAARAVAKLFGAPPELAALFVPGGPHVTGGDFKNTTAGLRLYNEVRVAEERRLLGVFATDTFGKPLMSLYQNAGTEWGYWTQMASEEGRTQIAADLVETAHLSGQTTADLGNTLYGLVANPLTSGATSVAAVSSAYDSTIGAFNNAVEAQVVGSEAHRQELVRLAATDPNKFVAQLAKDDAALSYAVFKPMADIAVGEAEIKAVGVVAKGAGTGIVRFGEMLGADTKAGSKALAAATPVGEEAAAGQPSYLNDLSAEAKQAIGVRQLVSTGGMTNKDAQTTKQIIGQIEGELAKQGYTRPIKLLFRPSNPFQAANALAKVELVPIKSVSPLDLLLGAPEATLGETAVFKPTKPTDLPGFFDYPAAEQNEIVARFDTRIKEYDQFHGHAPAGSKLAKMKDAIDQTQTFHLGQGRTAEMQLATEKVGGATVLKYTELKVQGQLIHRGAPVPIGSDLDGLIAVDAATGRTLPTNVDNFVYLRYNQLGAQAAKKGYANAFHDFTLRGADVSAADYPSIAHFGLRHLPEAEARRIAQRLANTYNRGRTTGLITAEEILAGVGGVFDRPVIHVTDSDAFVGPAGVVFTHF